MWVWQGHMKCPRVDLTQNRALGVKCGGRTGAWGDCPEGYLGGRQPCDHVPWGVLVGVRQIPPDPARSQPFLKGVRANYPLGPAAGVAIFSPTRTQICGFPILEGKSPPKPQI